MSDNIHYQMPDDAEKIISEEDFVKPLDISSIKSRTGLKDWIVNYVGHHPLNQGGENITVEKIVEVFSQDFPEFLLVIAEENWVRGYQQALTDIDEGEELMRNENS